MKKFLIVASLAFAMMSCGGNKAASEGQEAPETDTKDATTLTLNDGKWRLSDYPGEAEIVQMDSTQNYYLQFDASNNTFGMQTDCNSIGGEYKVNGDSIKFDNIAATQMACPNEAVEVAMKGILPRVDTYVILPDSTLQLRSDARIMAQFTHVAE